ncbi:MAG: TetR/AcrR family transcriptional regulator [Acidimicrobiia bacterium]
MTTVAVSPASTRERLLDAALEVFLAKGYEGARLADVARAAGLTTGAVYSNFRNKAELLSEALGGRTSAEIDALLGAIPAESLPDALRMLGRGLVDPPDARERTLLLDAIVAARRDPDLARLLRDRAERRGGQLGRLIAGAQRAGTVDGDLDPEAVTRLCTAIALGSVVARALDIPAPDPTAWGDLIDRIVGAIAPDPEVTP